MLNLKVFKNFPEVKDSVSLHMVEVSPALARIQIEKLTDEKLTNKQSSRLTENYDSYGTDNTKKGSVDPYYHCTTKYGISASWYKTLNDVPPQPSFYLAHEFFDALPVCKFQVSMFFVLSWFVFFCFFFGLSTWPKTKRTYASLGI